MCLFKGLYFLLAAVQANSCCVFVFGHMLKSAVLFLTDQVHSSV